MFLHSYVVCLPPVPASPHACLASCITNTGQRELQVLDYQNCAYTLIGLTASAYACWFMGQNMQARYQK